MVRDASQLSGEFVQGTHNAPPPLSAPVLSERRLMPWLKNTLWTALFAVLLLAGLVAYGASRYGSFAALVAALQGRVLYAEPAHIELEPLKAGESSTIRVRLRSLAARPIKVLGASSRPHCGCLIAKELPTEFAPGEVKDVSIQFKAQANGAPEFEFVVTFYTNVVGEQPYVVFHGRVLVSDTASGSSKGEG